MELSPDDPRPTYVRIAEEVRAEITSGKLKTRERLPSLRELAERYNVAPLTVQNALHLLRDEGWIFNSSTRGYFVREEPPADRQADLKEGSAAYHAITRQLEVMRDGLQQVNERISELEGLIQENLPKQDSPKR